MVALALALAGCGGSSGGGSRSTAASTSTTASATVPGQAAFDAQLGAACKRANAAFANASTSKGKAAAISHFLTSARSIKPPSQLQTLYSRYLDVIGKELKLQQKGNSAGLFRLASGEARPLVQQLGAKGCLTG